MWHGPFLYRIFTTLKRLFHLRNILGLFQMMLMTSKTSLQKWSGVFLLPSVSPAFFQIGTVTYQHRLRFRWRGFMYEFLPLIHKVVERATETRCGTERLAREHQACSNASRRACQVRVPERNGLRGETQLGRSAFELCESTVDVTQR